MKQDDKLITSFTAFAGCGAKLSPAFLDKALCGLIQPVYPQVLSDFSHSEDCGVYQVSEDLAIVSTLDFFPPMCDDSFDFGRIAAANALSDIYSMGATPHTALSIVCFPEATLDISLLKEIMRGAMDALVEAGVALVGGHSIKDSDVKFGLSINGSIHPDKILRNNTHKSDEVFILTKPIGVGIINTASRAHMATKEEEEDSLSLMMTLNKASSEVISEFDVTSCTDITGFGLLGHVCEMALENSIGITIESTKVPLLNGALKWATMGLLPGAAYTNYEARSPFIEGLEEIPDPLNHILFDPQTSGGLLFSISKEKEQEVLEALQLRKVEGYTIGYSDETHSGVKVI
ncbi:MAG: selenide, water dikinase SelD [Spirochaetia bacterium]|nr:selenide, water dikinase SelD [Spirochaetia bacterium]